MNSPRLIRLVRWGALVALCAGVPNSYGQNRIPDSGFEDINDCSQGANFSILNDWLLPWGCSAPPYFNACSPPPQDIYSGVPINLLGTEPAHGGQGYLALITYTTAFENFKSYVTATFTPPLTTGEYCVQFWLSLGDSSTWRTNTFHGIVTTLIPEIANDEDSVWAETAQMVFNTSNVGTNGWSLMEASFVALGGERQLTLGNFLKGEALLADTVFVGWHSWFNRSTYYLDDVYLGSCDVGVSERADATQLVVYPDPVLAGEVLNVRWGTSNTELFWQLTAAQGKIVLDERVIMTQGQAVLVLGTVAPGAYVLHLSDKVGSTAVRKVLVR